MIFVTVLTFYIALIYASTAIGLLGFAEAVLFVLAYLYLLYLSKKLHVSIQIPIAAAEQGGSVSVQLHAVNDSRFFCAKIRCRLRYGSTFSGRLKSAWENGAAVYPGKNRYQAKMQLPYTLGKSPRESQSYLSIVSSLVFSLMDAACPLYAAWYSGSRQDIVRARVDDEEGYWRCLRIRFPTI